MQTNKSPGGQCISTFLLKLLLYATVVPCYPKYNIHFLSFHRKWTSMGICVYLYLLKVLPISSRMNCGWHTASNNFLMTGNWQHLKKNLKIYILFVHFPWLTLQKDIIASLGFVFLWSMVHQTGISIIISQWAVYIYIYIDTHIYVLKRFML